MHVRLVIMCKAPVAGCVKTRLMPEYSPRQAAGIHQAMAATVIHRAMRLFDDVVIAADQPEHPFFSHFDCPVRPQGEGDLGERMARQMLAAFHDDVESVLLLGTDSPHMPDERLRLAVEKLSMVDVVLGPVEDGGYDLIAMKQPWPLFKAIQWSTSRVLRQSLDQIRKLGLSVSLLESGFDVDRAVDLKRAVANGWDCQI